MRASLDTNAIIHFYKAGLQNVLFDFFDEGVFIYEQIRKVELNHHGQEILNEVDQDIKLGKIQVYSYQALKEQAVHKIFDNMVKDNKLLYGAGDLGEVYAISLAQTLGAYALVTNDTKQGGPYMSLLQFVDNEVMPFTSAEILVIRYLMGKADADQTIRDFNEINEKADMNWSLKGHLTRFRKRFWEEPYKGEEAEWLQNITQKTGKELEQQTDALEKSAIGATGFEPATSTSRT